MRRSDRERLPWLLIAGVAGGVISFLSFESVGTVRIVGTLVGIGVGLAAGWLGHAVIRGQRSS